jgi:hypothetical protein
MVISGAATRFVELGALVAELEEDFVLEGPVEELPVVFDKVVAWEFDVVCAEVEEPPLLDVGRDCVEFPPVVAEFVVWELGPEVTADVDPVWEAVALEDDDAPTEQVPSLSKIERLKLMGLPPALASLVLNENE